MISARAQAVMKIASERTPETTTVDVRKQADALFGRDVFNADVMRQRLPRDIYKELEKTICGHEPLNPAIANTVANAMKDWAIDNGASHYTHWFQPMTGLTAEKHDAFLSPTPDGRMISEFSGKMLISGEPDASSFPSGGIRSTFEARGYTAWDPTVPVFIARGPQGNTLHIPTVFYSYSGEALDRKIPLMRSLGAVSRQALRVLRLFGSKSNNIRVNVGAEQEYFLVDRRLAALRPDLLMAGRTLMGAPSPKGQEMEDHYFGAIPSRVLAFMQEVEESLVALGIPAKTRHNEVAPGQFELAPLFEDANMATDHNMLIMNVLKQVAAKHEFVCLLHEKPFAGVNGSGKHNNWSLSDSEGNNLLNPGKTPHDNAQFLTFLAAVLRAAHLHADMLRLGTIGAGNDHRLGANEAPPAIISVYLGEQLTEILENIIAYKPHQAGNKSESITVGVSSLPPLPVDLSDRNRTSPFAFTGNKFEFRAVGSSQSVAPINIVLNTAMACALDDIATELEASIAGGATLNEALQTLLPRLFSEHMAVVFNGNGYSAAWPEEAKRRGLHNHNNTVDALAHYSDPEVMNAFLRQGVLSEREMLSRQDILLETYVKTVEIEAHILLDMARTTVRPTAQRAQAELADMLVKTRAAVGDDAVSETKVFNTFRKYVVALEEGIEQLEKACQLEHGETNILDIACAIRDGLLPAMNTCRAACDTLEQHIDSTQWPLPSYAELMWTH